MLLPFRDHLTQKETMLLLFLPVAALIVYFLFKGNGAARRASVAKPAGKYALPLPTSKPAHHWQDGGRYETEVVVELAYQDAIAQLAGEGDDPKAPQLAILVPDDANPHDDKAVGVFIGGRLIGYLGREEARRFRRKLALKNLFGENTSCDAMLRGGGTWQGKRLSHAVWLDIEPYE
ncbi:hypothetical protein AAKU55_004876 [Oxalobacteraceae bacterium GrIS 1.11]